MNNDPYADSPESDRKGPRHAWVYSAEERGRRIRWRVVTISLYLALEGGAWWGVHRLGRPEPIAIPVVAVPYWTLATAVWASYGPEMPGLN